MNVFQVLVEFFEVAVDGFRLFQEVLGRFMLLVTTIFFFLFCSRHVAICLVRTKASVLLFTKQTATFVPARKYSQGNTAKKVGKLKRQLGTLARTTSPRTHPKIQFLQSYNWIISRSLDCKFFVNFPTGELKRVKSCNEKNK